MKLETKLDYGEFQKSLSMYLAIRKNVDAKTELRRRAKNVGMRAIGIYKQKGMNLQEFNAKMRDLGYRIRVRGKIANKETMSWGAKVRWEKRARKNAKGFTATGWFPSVEKLGGRPSDKANRKGPRRGYLVEKAGKSETLVNSQPGAAHVQKKCKNVLQLALNQEAADMNKYILRKQREIARKRGMA